MNSTKAELASTQAVSPVFIPPAAAGAGEAAVASGVSAETAGAGVG